MRKIGINIYIIYLGETRARRDNKSVDTECVPRFALANPWYDPRLVIPFFECLAELVYLGKIIFFI